VVRFVPRKKAAWYGGTSIAREGPTAEGPIPLKKKIEENHSVAKGGQWKRDFTQPGTLKISQKPGC